MGKRACKQCGKRIGTTPCAKVFCSAECRGQYQQENPKYCSGCGAQIEIGYSLAIWQTATSCGKDCPSKVKTEPRVRKPRQAPVDLTNAIGRFRLLERDGFRCIYCGSTAFEAYVCLQADHIVPLSRGGTNTLANIATACSDCNYAKMAEFLREDIQEELLAEVHRRNQNFEIAPDAVYAPHADRMKSKSSFLRLVNS